MLVSMASFSCKSEEFEMPAPLTSTPNSQEGSSEKERVCRRSIVFNSTPVDPLILEDKDEEEEEERSARRKSARTEKSLANISNSVEIPNFLDSYVWEQYALYSHLYMENKISSKNAWSIKIIDMLSLLCNSKESNNFQMAYTSIDIGAKVYGFRVDNVHSEVLKMARAMARAASENSPDLDSSDVPDGDENNVKVMAPRRRRKKLKIIQDVNALIGEIAKLVPTDFTSRLNMEVGSTSSLLSTFLKEDASGCTFNVLDETQRVFEDVDPLVTIDIKLPIKEISLNPGLKMKLGSFNLTIGDEIRDPKSLAQTREAVFDENGIPLHELDGPIPNVFSNVEAEGNNLNSDHQDDNLGLANTKRVIPFDFRHLERTLVPVPSEYGFNGVTQHEQGEQNNFIDFIWAGPSHWKLKCIQRGKEVFSGRPKAGAGKKKKYVRKVPQEIDFSKVVELDLSKTVGSKTRRRTAKYNSITRPFQKLPQEDIAALLRNFILKPGACPIEWQGATTQCDVEPYAYENANDSFYCSEMDKEGMSNDVECPTEEQRFDDLIAMPEKVAVANLAFSTKAKRVDMKKLKNAIWDTLNNTELEEKVEFFSLYSKLPDSLTQDEKKNLSPHVAFVAALHVCNEKSLYLTPEGPSKIYLNKEREVEDKTEPVREN